jgi:EAL domain-containing protein (putative c-di-GMP-specific phosphodiesterase class I)
MLDGRRDRLRLDLKRQLSLGWPELDLYYQPIVDLNDGAVVGFESLLRWHHPDRGAVSPGVFVPLAEESGVIAPLGRWVLERATRQLRAWQDAEPAERMLTMSVNVSARQLCGDRLIEDVRHALEASGVAPQSLTLEITESALVADPQVAAATLARLEQLGVRMAIDDFGTGYSSLSYLQRFPVDVLKIDRTFVRDADRGARQRALFRAIVELAHALDLQVVAEGIERSTEVELCQQVHCRFGQGFLFARPLPADEARRLMPSLPQTEVCKDPVDTRMVPTSA